MNPTSRPMTMEIALSLFTGREGREAGALARRRDARLAGNLADAGGLLQAGREGLLDQPLRLAFPAALDLRCLTIRTSFNTSATSVRRPVFILSRFCL